MRLAGMVTVPNDVFWGRSCVVGYAHLGDCLDVKCLIAVRGPFFRHRRSIRQSYNRRGFYVKNTTDAIFRLLWILPWSVTLFHHVGVGVLVKFTDSENRAAISRFSQSV